MKPSCSFFSRLGKKFDRFLRILIRLTKRYQKMTQAFDDLRQKVDANLALQQQIIALIQQLVERLANTEDPAAIAELAARVQTATEALAASIGSVPPQ